MNSAHLIQMVQFIQLAIANLDTELLVLVGTPETIKQLELVQHYINPILPSLVVCIDSDVVFKTNYCPHCPTTRLTIMDLPGDLLVRAEKLLSLNYYDSNYIVLIWSQVLTPKDGEMIAAQFRHYNMVVVELFNEDFTVISWSINAMGIKFNESFRGPTELFTSNAANALAFRRQLHHFPGPPIFTFYYLSLMAPYQFHVQKADTGEIQLAGAVVHLCKLVADHFKITLQPRLRQFQSCKNCYNPHPVSVEKMFIPLYSFHIQNQKM